MRMSDSPERSATSLPLAPVLNPVASRRALVEQVAGQLAERILEGTYRPGDFLPPEGRLAALLNVSRTVVREAMQSLRSQGLVQVSQGRRPQVRQVDSAAAIGSLATWVRRSDCSLLDLIEVRQPLEGEIAARAAERATPDQRARLRASLDDQATARTLDAAVEADVRFHDVLAEASGNPLFRLLLACVSGPLWESRRRTITSTGNERALVGHRRILREVERGRAVAARREMLRHLGEAEDDLRRLHHEPQRPSEPRASGLISSDGRNDGAD